jgi:hypothetical protein
VEKNNMKESALLRASMRRCLWLIGLALCVVARYGSAAEAVRQIGVYVLPYYESARSAGEAPRVAVARKFDAQLASAKAEDIVAVSDAIKADPGLITPMTLMVLAIRSYDVGLRDDAVFWFYVAKDRFVTLAEVLDLRHPALAQVAEATKNFAILAGPVINGYAFCDPKNQMELRARALEWVEKNSYQALFVPQLPARPGDRSANLSRAIERLRAEATKERDHFRQTANVEQFRKARDEQQAADKFCW